MVIYRYIIMYCLRGGRMYKEVKYIDDNIKVNVEILRELKTSYHCHKSIELLYMLEGTLEVDKLDHKYILSKGDLYIVNNEDIHKVKTTGNENIVLIAHISEDVIKELHGGLCKELFRCRYIKSISHKDYLCNEEYLKGKREVVQKVTEYLLKIYIINNLYKEAISSPGKLKWANKYRSKYDYYKDNLIGLIIDEFSVTECFKKLASLDEEMSRKNYLFMRYVNENYNKKITLDEISKDLNFSKYYISRLLNQKEFGGLNNNIKIFRAYSGRDLLFITDKSVGEISQLIGFGTAGVFIKSFKEIFGATPAEYRKSYKVSNEVEVKFKLDEENIEEVLKDNIEDYLEFTNNIQDSQKRNLRINLISGSKRSKYIPKIKFILKSDNPVQDIYKLKDRDSLYSIDFSNCAVTNDIADEEDNVDYRYDKLLKCIREGSELEETISINDLISENNIETSLYYYYSFINELKGRIVEYNRDYLVTGDEKEGYRIFILLRENLYEETNEEIEINFKLPKGVNKVMVHKLNKGELQRVEPVDYRQREIIRRAIMPQCSFNIINNEKLTLNSQRGEQYLIEVYS